MTVPDQFDPLDYVTAALALQGFEVPTAWHDEIARYVGIAAEFAMMLPAESGGLADD